MRYRETDKEIDQKIDRKIDQKIGKAIDHNIKQEIADLRFLCSHSYREGWL